MKTAWRGDKSTAEICCSLLPALVTSFLTDKILQFERIFFYHTKNKFYYFGSCRHMSAKNGGGMKMKYSYLYSLHFSINFYVWNILFTHSNTQEKYLHTWIINVYECNDHHISITSKNDETFFCFLTSF